VPSPCVVPWCIALADGGASCRVHRERPKLHPLLLRADEELVDGCFAACPACEEVIYHRDTKTTTRQSLGSCSECRGSGECASECEHGHSCGHECEACDGSGLCETCGGSGYGGVRRKAS